MGASPGPRWILGERISLVEPGLELCMAREAAGGGAQVFLFQEIGAKPTACPALLAYARDYEKLDDPSLPAVIEPPSEQTPRLVLESASGPSLPEIADDTQGITEAWVLEACRQVLGAFQGLHDAGWRHGLLGPEFCRIRNEQSGGETDLRLLLYPPLEPPDASGTVQFTQTDRSSLARTLRCLANIASSIQVVTKPLPGDVQPLPPTGNDIAGAIRSLARRMEGGVTGGQPLTPGQALAEIRQMIRNQHQLRVNPAATPSGPPDDPFLEDDPEEIDQETSQLLARIVRKEMMDQKQGNWFQRLNRNPAFVIPAFLLVMGAIVYSLWPMSPDEMYRRGALLMESENQDDWYKAWDQYLSPLVKRFPDQAQRENMPLFQARMESLRRGKTADFEAKSFQNLSEGQRLFLEGVHLYQMGDIKTAREHWGRFVLAYEGVPEAQPWTRKAKEAIEDKLPFQKKGNSDERIPGDFLRALENIRDFKRMVPEKTYQKKVDALKELYKNDPESLKKIESVLGSPKP